MTTNNGVAVRQETGLVLDDERMALLRKTIANDAPELEFEMFVNICKRTGLDPFAKQIYLINRKSHGVDRWQPQTSIDGYRLIADRTGQYAGSDEPVYAENENGTQPVAATVTVYKMIQGQRCPFTATARWSEYAVSFNGKLGDFWQRMPYLMLAKCAESLALRKAFPQELSGLYTREEMGQADNAVVQDTEPVAAAYQVDQETGEITDRDDLGQSIIDEYLASIYAAKSKVALVKIGEAIGAAGVSSAELRTAYSSRLQELSPTKPSMAEVAEADIARQRRALVEASGV